MGGLPLVLGLGVVIGGILGALGGGGAILTVPALVYLVGMPPQEATTSSLVIVGATALVGTASYLAAGRVRGRVALAFGALGLPSTWLGSYANHRVDGSALLLAFAVLMLAAAAAMLVEQRRGSVPDDDGGTDDDGADGSGLDHPRPAARAPLPARPVRAATDTVLAAPMLQSRAAPSWTVLVAAAVAVGLLTGFFGVGGGFVIVPTLVLALRMPMHLAVGTSLAIIALNSTVALAARATTALFDWSVIVPFSVAAIIATLLGKHVADRLPARRLHGGFIGLLVLVACYTAWRSLAA
jgi:uncharacterized membrane protein YfcA